jgi:ATP-binding protein involved in chromosome partitioning
MSIDKKIEQLLKITPDPVLAKTIYDLNIKPSFHIEDNVGSLHLSAGFPITLLKQTFLPRLQLALKQQFPDLHIDVTLDQFIKAHRTQLPGKGLRGVKNTIAIASGKGGVGKSTVSVNLAVSLARLGARVGILDADIYGPSIPTMMGKHEPVQYNEEHYVPVKAHGIQTMSIGYLTDETNSTLIWRGPMLAKALLQMLDLTQWDELDYLFIDLPPGTGDIQLSLVQKIPLAGAIVVTTPQTVATHDADKALNLFEKTNIHVLGLVENMSLHRCMQCGHQEPLFGMGGAQALSTKHHCRVLAQLPLDARIGRDGDKGTPTAQQDTHLSDAFTTLALQTAIALDERPLNYADKFPPIITE